MITPFFYFILFLFGLAAGSFLNCVIYRLQFVEKEGAKDSLLNTDIFTGRSFCPHCKHRLSWKDLIPVFSFLFLKGKCRYCKEKISFQYPLVETATGLLFLLIFNFQFSIYNEFSIFNFQNLLFAIYCLLITCFLIVIFVYDLKHYIIPDRILYPAIGTVFLYQVIFNFQFSILNEFSIFNFQTTNFYSSILSAFGASVFFLFIYLISKGAWMGFGDVKLAFFMGLFLGWPGIITAMFLAFFLGAIVGTILIFLGRKTLKSQVPFAPFLIIGTLMSLFFGNNILYFWRSLFLI